MERFNFITGSQSSWHKHVMEKHVLSDQTGFLSGQNLSLAYRQKVFAGLKYGAIRLTVHVHVHVHVHVSNVVMNIVITAVLTCNPSNL